MLYFLQADAPTGPIKIGFTTRHGGVRRAHAQTYNAKPVVLLAECDGDEATERRLHRMFRETRLEGEWFEPSAALRELVDALAEGQTLAGLLA